MKTRIYPQGDGAFDRADHWETQIKVIRPHHRRCAYINRGNQVLQLGPIARARWLVSQPAYPPLSVLRAVAGRLAEQFQKRDFSE